MFKVGEYVFNANNGICMVKDITHPDFVAEKEKMYYVILPLAETKSKLYVPVDTVDKRFRNVMSKDEAWKLIDAIPTIEETWIDNDKEREKKYKEAIYSEKPELLIGIIKNMYFRKKKRIEKGKKNTVVDERYFKIAEELLYEELTFALGKKKNEIQNLIDERVKN